MITWKWNLKTPPRYIQLHHNYYVTSMGGTSVANIKAEKRIMSRLATAYWVVPFERTHNQLKTYPVDFSNSAGKLLNDANSHSRDGQWEHSFRHSNSYEQYFHNLPGRQTQPFLLFGLPPVRSPVRPFQPQRPESHGTSDHAPLFSWDQLNVSNEQTRLYSR